MQRTTVCHTHTARRVRLRNPFGCNRCCVLCSTLHAKWTDPGPPAALDGAECTTTPQKEATRNDCSENTSEKQQQCYCGKLPAVTTAQPAAVGTQRLGTAALSGSALSQTAKLARLPKPKRTLAKCAAASPQLALRTHERRPTPAHASGALHTSAGRQPGRMICRALQRIFHAAMVAAL